MITRSPAFSAITVSGGLGEDEAPIVRLEFIAGVQSVAAVMTLPRARELAAQILGQVDEAEAAERARRPLLGVLR